MRILFLPKYHREGSSSRYRIFNYVRYFEELGHKVEIKPFLYDGYVRNLYDKKPKNILSVIACAAKRALFVLKHKNEYDVLIIEKELFTNLPYIFEKFLLKSCKYALDFDDAISVCYKKHPIKRIFLKNKINRLSEDAVLTTVGNKWYFDEIRTGNIKYLPTVIDAEKYDTTSLAAGNNEPPILVWIGSLSTSKYLLRLKSVFDKLKTRHHFRLRIIGANVDFESINAECMEWSEETEFELLRQCDIGIMPLESTEWEYGKCGLKIIQYMASGLPAIASPTPANREIIVDAETGFISKTDDEWVECLSRLITDNELRNRLGLAARKRVEESYTYQVWGERYVRMVEEAVQQ